VREQKSERNERGSNSDSVGLEERKKDDGGGWRMVIGSDPMAEGIIRIGTTSRLHWRRCRRLRNDSPTASKTFSMLNLEKGRTVHCDDTGIVEIS
jgi:hypothetical protein